MEISDHPDRLLEQAEDLDALLSLPPDEINLQELKNMIRLVLERHPELLKQAEQEGMQAYHSQKNLNAVETRIQNSEVFGKDTAKLRVLIDQDFPALLEALDRFLTAFVAFDQQTGLDLELLYGHALFQEWNEACMAYRKRLRESDDVRGVKGIPSVSLARAHWYHDILRSVLCAGSASEKLSRFRADEIPHPDYPQIMVPNLLKQTGIGFRHPLLTTKAKKVRGLMALQRMIAAMITGLEREAVLASLHETISELERFPSPPFFYGAGFPAASYAAAFDTIEESLRNDLGPEAVALAFVRVIATSSQELKRILDAMAQKVSAFSRSNHDVLPPDFVQCLDFVAIMPSEEAVPLGFLIPCPTVVSEWNASLERKWKASQDAALARSEEYQAARKQVEVGDRHYLIRLGKLALQALNAERRDALVKEKHDQFQFAEGAVKDQRLFSFLDQLTHDPNVYSGRNAVLCRNARGLWMIVFDHPKIKDAKAGYVFDPMLREEERLLSPKALEDFSAVISGLQKEIRDRKQAFFQQFNGQEVSLFELKKLGIRVLPHMRVTFEFCITEGVLMAVRKITSQVQAIISFRFDLKSDRWVN